MFNARLPLKSHLLNGSFYFSGCKGTHFFPNSQIFHLLFFVETVPLQSVTARIRLSEQKTKFIWIFLSRNLTVDEP